MLTVARQKLPNNTHCTNHFKSQQKGRHFFLQKTISTVGLVSISVSKKKKINLVYGELDNG